MEQKATVFAPASIGNVGPGFDVLGLAVDGVGDVVTVELISGADEVTAVTGRDAAMIPLEPGKNACVIAARAMLSLLGKPSGVRISVEKGLPVAGGMGGSAASSVGGALAAALAAGATPDDTLVMKAALEGEGAVAGRHLDNIAPCVLGGLALVRSTEPMDVVAIPLKQPWYVALVTPSVRVETKAARALLPMTWERKEWIQQMANTAGVVVAFLTGDEGLVRRALDDLYAEPRRASLIPHFHGVKQAALNAGALGASISGSGPTVFALCASKEIALRAAAAMQHAFQDVTSTAHVGAIATRGARPA